MDNKPLFSVVTVCYNASTLINKTIESVLAQGTDAEPESTYMDGGSLFEYIIQDGASTDNTLSIVDSYKSSFDEKNISFTVNSGKDNGIYDAMNKAVQAANGIYVIFMNADDCFYSDHVLTDVMKSLKNTPANGDFNNAESLPDIIYGDCIVKELSLYFKFRKCYDLIHTRMPFSHQACFAKREHLLISPFDTKYRITADYAFLLKCYMDKKTFYDSEVCIALTTADGLSSINMLDTFVEVNEVCKNLGVPRFSDEEYVKKLKIMNLKQFVLKYFPKFIKKAIRKSQLKKRNQLADVTVPPWCL